MNCTVCRGPATIRIPRHTSAFCPFHFQEHVSSQVAHAIEKYHLFGHDKRLLLALSGGKDGMVLGDILMRMRYDIQAVHINNGFGEYSRKAEDLIRDFAQRYGIPLLVYSFQELLGFDFGHALRYSRMRACSVCGAVRRYFLNRIATDHECDVIVTGHTLDDETSAFLGNMLHWHTDEPGFKGPLMPEERCMVRRAKPLVRLTDHEVRMYADLNDMPLMDGVCPHARGSAGIAYKRILDALEREMTGTKAHFYTGYLKRAKARFTPAGAGEREDAGCCPCCGYRTTRKDLCFVCMLKERASHG